MARKRGRYFTQTSLTLNIYFYTRKCVSLKVIDVSGGSLAWTEVRRPGVDQVGKQEEQRVADSLVLDVVLQSK